MNIISTTINGVGDQHNQTKLMGDKPSKFPQFSTHNLIYTDLFPLLSKEIVSIIPSKLGAPDKYIWIPTKDGVYTTKSGYSISARNTTILDNGYAPSLELEWIKKVWSSPCLPKIKLFMWKLIQGALPLGVNLEKRGCSSTVTCPRCGEQETADHLILSCSFAKQVWAIAPLHQEFDPNQFTSLKEALISGMKSQCLPPTGVASPVFPWICWGLWTARNKLIFENKTLSTAEVLNNSINSAREWCLAQPLLPSKNPPPNSATIPQPVVDDCCMVYTDAAWRASDGATGCGWIIQDTGRHITQQGSKCFDCTSSAFIGEGLAIRLALTHALSLGIIKVCVYSDCQLLVRAILSKSPPVELYGIVRDIEALSSLFTCCSFSFISRSLNSGADLLAKLALCNVGHPTS